MTHAAWGTDEDEWALITCVFCFLVAGASLIDLGLHMVHRFLEHHSGLHIHSRKEHEAFHAYAVQPGAIFFKIWNRLQTEMMVLGCLAFLLWVAVQYGFFEWARHDEEGEEEGQLEVEGEGEESREGEEREEDCLFFLDW